MKIIAASLSLNWALTVRYDGDDKTLELNDDVPTAD